VRVRQGEPIRVFTARDLDFSRVTASDRSGSRLPLPEPEGPGADAAQRLSRRLPCPLAPLAGARDRDRDPRQRPGELWIEDAEQPGMQRIALPELDDQLLQRLAEQVARVSHQGINREHPLLAATLPDGARIQLVGPPATRRHWALAIRRHRLLDLPLDAYDRGRSSTARPRPAPTRKPSRSPFLRDAVRRRLTILISGGTSTGKTTFLNAMLREIPPRSASCWSRTRPN
jgi:type IV secretion system protein VirB11